METAKIVIGANFGDEGKGLMTDYFANEARKQNKSCLVICYNGGSQKGHTVVSPSGLRHVFHHFGAGSFEGADTYLASEFIVNPIIFNNELLELKAKVLSGCNAEGLSKLKADKFSEMNKKNLPTKCFADGKCRITTPFDMMINQIIEEYRGDSKHGSCGLGIFETIVRSREYRDLTIYELAGMPVNKVRSLLDEIATEYLPDRLKQLGVENIPAKWDEILSNKDSIIENYIDDFSNMLENMEIVNSSIIDDYDYVIFEGAQGLLLDQNNISYMPHLTPSNTGLKNPVDIIGVRKADIEVCYVSRTYMTRHGAGRFDTECRKSDINAEIIDLTNVPNPYQDTIRYGTLNLGDLKQRIASDSSGTDYKKSVAITHCNEYEVKRDELKKIFSGFGIYMSDGMTYNSVYVL